MNFEYYEREYFNRLDESLIEFDCWGEEILPLNIIEDAYDRYHAQANFKNLIEREG